MYGQLLVINVPNLLWIGFMSWAPLSQWAFVVSLLFYGLIVAPCVWGASISFAYRRISRSERSIRQTQSLLSNVLHTNPAAPITVFEAFGEGIKCAPKLVLGGIQFGLVLFVKILLLLIPGVLYFINAHFFDYFIVLNGDSPGESIRHSQDLVSGQNYLIYGNQVNNRWWEVFFAVSFGIVLFDFIIRLMVRRIVPVEFPLEGNAFEAIEGALLFLFYPFNRVYQTLLAYRLNVLRIKSIP
jgi:hypothetical protein